MMQIRASGSSVPGLLALMLWAGNAQAVPCQNNLSASNPDSVYTDHGNGTVTDTRTGLMWKQCAEGLSGASCQTGSAQSFTWANALAHAEASTFVSYADWRLPNVKELSSLVEDCRSLPAINTNRFPNTPGSDFTVFWSGSPTAAHSNGAWVVFFDDGNAAAFTRSYDDARVRLVRGGQSSWKQNPSPMAGYLGFIEGNPGIEDDGVFITSSQVNFTNFSLTAEPKSVVGDLEDGVTLTVISRLPRATAYSQIYFEFGYLGAQCLVRVNDNDVVRSQKDTVEAAYYSGDVLSSITDAVKAGISNAGALITNPVGCAEAELSKMFFNRIEFLHFGLNAIEIDAVILDAGLVARF